MAQTLTTSEFVAKAKDKHGAKYIYREVIYVNARSKVVVRCRKHGAFEIAPNNHLNGQGCKLCGKDQALASRGVVATTDLFVAEARKVHGARYDYSKVRYVDSRTAVTIVCKEHGRFQQNPRSHLRGFNCKKCADAENGANKAQSKAEFVTQAQAVHGRLYKYPGEYVNRHTLIKIECKKHGIFEQLPLSHIKGHGCPHCGFSTKSGYRHSNVKIDGHEFRVQGFEHFALDWMKKRVATKLIKNGASCPVVPYGTRRYYPDFWIPSQNKIVEVKSVWTLCGTADRFNNIKEKRLACERAGYTFALLVFGKTGHKLTLPKDWHALTLHKIRKHLSCQQ